MMDRTRLARGAVNAAIQGVTREEGRPLEPGLRAQMAPLLGHDFSRVRVHDSERAGATALALGAAAYTVGRHVVFAPHAYAPHATEGRVLLAHELLHVDEQCDAVPSTLRVSSPLDAHERDAEHASRRVARGERVGDARIAKPTSDGATIHRSLLGGILGGVSGALTGALIGGLIGGPIGAIVGGVGGLIAGALIGNRATTKSRPLTDDEKTYAKDVFQDSVDYDKIEITRDSMMAAGAPRTIGNTINLKSDWGHFKGDTLELTDVGRETLIHEMGHVWQYQNGGLQYIPDSIIAQIKAAISGGNRNAAYDWRSQHKAGVPWENWNPEQQASAIEDYNKLLRKSKTPSITIPELADLAILLPYIDKVRHRQGAPGSEKPQTGGEGPSLSDIPSLMH